MAPVSPLVLRRVERFLRTPLMARPSSWILHALAHNAFPVMFAERFASALPQPALPGGEVVDPFVVRFDEATRGTASGPLAGENVVVKDSIDVAGAPTNLGLDDGAPAATRDATIIERVRAAGGFVLGKTKMTELGLDGLGAQIRSSMPQNPRAPGYFPGGSSTGTAVAVAAGLARYGVGGDGMGSIRIPAAFCGLVGLKPTHGRLPIAGYPSVAPSMDVPGPIARNAADCALLWQVLADQPVVALTSWVPPRIGVIRTLGPELATADVARNFNDVLARLGSAVLRVDVPLAPHCAGIGMVAASHEVATGPHGAREVSPAGRLTMTLGRALSAAGLERIRARRALLREQMLRAIEEAGVLAMPTSAIPAPAVTRLLLDGGQDGILLRAVGVYTPLANVVGFPAIAVPTGVDARGRPLSIMFVGAPNSETQLLRIALAVEERVSS